MAYVDDPDFAARGVCPENVPDRRELPSAPHRGTLLSHERALPSQFLTQGRVSSALFTGKRRPLPSLRRVAEKGNSYQPTTRTAYFCGNPRPRGSFVLPKNANDTRDWTQNALPTGGAVVEWSDKF